MYFSSSLIINSSSWPHMLCLSPGNFMYYAFRESKSRFSENLWHSCWWEMLSLSFWMLLRTIRLGILKNISASLHSTCSLKTLYFWHTLSILTQNWMSWSLVPESCSYSLPRVHAFSYISINSTSSLLFLSCGSRASMFSLYFLRSTRKQLKDCLIFSARAWTDSACPALRVWDMSSAA